MSVGVVDGGAAARFWAKVVKGPRPRDCWLWSGAVGDDGYGRFWIRRDGHPAMLRAHRYAYETVHGALSPGLVVMHEVCDEPICCRVDLAGPSHLVAGTQAENLTMMGARGRGWGGAHVVGRHASTNRAAVVARSRALRDAVKNGWNQDAIIAAIESLADPWQPSLLDLAE